MRDAKNLLGLQDEDGPAVLSPERNAEGAVDKFRNDMTGLGFRQANVLVHDDDREAVLAYVRRVQGRRLVLMLDEMKSAGTYDETLDLLATRRRPHNVPKMSAVMRLKASLKSKPHLTRVNRILETLQKIDNATYEANRKSAELRESNNNPELYYLYDEIAILLAEAYVYGMWVSAEWALLQIQSNNQGAPND